MTRESLQIPLRAGDGVPRPPLASGPAAGVARPALASNPAAGATHLSSPTRPAAGAAAVPRSLVVFALILSAGVALRALLLWLVGDIELQADEAAYLQQGAMWSRFGFYLGGPRFLWPPLYPGFLAFFVDHFGWHAIDAAKACQVALSAVVGTSVMALARRFFHRRAAIVAGAIWACYLPLAAYTHYLWSETLFLAIFLPTLYLMAGILEGVYSGAGLRIRILAAGLLSGLCLLCKEAVAPMPVLFVAALLAMPALGDLRTRAARALIYTLAAATLVLPWTVRNMEVYGRWVASGATLGRNLYWVRDRNYFNFDYSRRRSPIPGRAAGAVGRWLTAAPGGPARRFITAPNLIDESSANTRAGLAFIRDNPGFYLRTRIKRLADLLTPLSFFDRHYRLGLYQGVLARPWLRNALVFAALAATMLVMFFAVPGLLFCLRDRGHMIACVVPLACMAAPLALIAISRYRVFVEPLLIVLAAGFLCEVYAFITDRSGARRLAARPAAAVGAGWLLLLLLWLINAPEIFRELGRLV